MATTVLLLADTHVPARAKRLPGAVLDAVDEVDVVIHAGDWVDLETLQLLKGRSRMLHGVAGNNDGPELQERLPLVARTRIEDVEVAVVHETGTARGREARADMHFPDVDLLVFGHSHIPWDSTTPRGMRLLNPGSPTDRRRQPHCTMMLLRIAGAAVQAELVVVDRNR